MAMVLRLQTGLKILPVVVDKFIVKIGLILFCGLLLTCAHVVIRWIFPLTAFQKYDLFISPNYHEKITILWYVYEITAIFYRFLWAYILCEIGLKYNIKLFKIGFVFLIYYFIDGLMYMWNRNSYALANFILYGLMGIAIADTIFISKYKMKKV